jgi:hypothetical protein
MRARAQAVRTRAAVRSWQYRQRHLASGVWFRLRRVLADARAAYVISQADAARLIAEGYRPEPCGCEIAPEKTILFVSEAQLASLNAPRPIRVGLDPEFLAATAVALVPFDEARASRLANPQG